MTDIVDELQWRGLIQQHTDLDVLREHLNAGSVTFYAGFDPTGPSLHHGHLVQVLLMRHLQRAGHKPIVLVGGATGMVGDPRDSGERSMQPAEVVAGWAERLKQQLSTFVSFEGSQAAILVNNLDWTGEMTAINFLRDLGKYFRVGTMLNKDIVARRIQSDEGISYTEFSYQIIQANDYLELYKRYGATLETGGNDQWGNIVGGVDLVRKTEGASVHALTTPIITKSDGTKFGKSEGGAIWLNPEMMSPYAFYQFWLQVADEDVVKLLKIFTFLDRDQIEELAVAVKEQPHLREAQKVLAQEVTTLVHGADAVCQVQAATEALWGRGDLRDLDEKTLEAATRQLPSGTIVLGKDTIVDALVASGLEKGRSAARRTVASGGAYLNNVKKEDEDELIVEADLLAGSLVLVRRGRRHLGILRVL